MAVAWQELVDRLRTIASAGSTYSTDPYDRARYAELQGLVEEMVAAGVGRAPAEVAELLRDEGYVTPKVDVRAVVFDGDRVLLVREASDGRWSLPGGWADLGRSPAEVAVAEVAEETGLTVVPTKLLALLDKARHDPTPSSMSVYKAFVRCTLAGSADGGEPGTPHEVLDVGWFGRDELPPLSVSRVTPAQLARAFDHLDEPDLPADLD